MKNTRTRKELWTAWLMNGTYTHAHILMCMFVRLSVWDYALFIRMCLWACLLTMLAFHSQAVTHQFVLVGTAANTHIYTHTAAAAVEVKLEREKNSINCIVLYQGGIFSTLSLIHIHTSLSYNNQTTISIGFVASAKSEKKIGNSSNFVCNQWIR